ncbi:YigZ family protein [Clostridium tepidum]|uniref:YigZ family protein n=1 Tax=Clostridium tepidum TaxID=1962263 RepID=A0A1S9I134_9CLOT|nr:YigZ family protein [Clostridium tepidum]MCR1935263.1 YigZ family protein [Clostridium tepidum]MDU6878617.1 YigZ family protein [Clostridium botulinum]OOO61949.1 YigZ family protein [Clostridium tepidum]OOO64007.1 YigZ family protein [Clostridium tepidum]
MAYFTIQNFGKGDFEEKKSTFIGRAKRVYTEDEAKNFINQVKDEEKEAKHNVYAYVIGENMGIQRYSDDGEPQGTGGIPVLDVIKKNEVTDIVIVVTRYFGGILLGKGGLVRAYSKGAAVAIKDAGIVQKVKGSSINFTIEYDALGKIQYLFEQNLWHIENIEYTDKVNLTMLCELDMIPTVEKKVLELTNGNCKITKNEEKFYFKMDNRLYEDK